MNSLFSFARENICHTPMVCTGAKRDAHVVSKAQGMSECCGLRGDAGTS
jgi:hypothetical protein